MDMLDVNNFGEQCSICWRAQAVRLQFITCAHSCAFCAKCVGIWLDAERNYCPYCRAIWPARIEDNDLLAFTEDFDALIQVIIIGLVLALLVCIIFWLSLIIIIYSNVSQI